MRGPQGTIFLFRGAHWRSNGISSYLQDLATAAKGLAMHHYWKTPTRGKPRITAFLGDSRQSARAPKINPAPTAVPQAANAVHPPPGTPALPRRATPPQHRTAPVHPNWAALAHSRQVEALMLDAQTARLVQARLLMYGVAPTTPVTFIQSTAAEAGRVLRTTLDILPLALKEAGVTMPGLTLLRPMAPPRTTTPVPPNRKTV